MIKQRFKIQGMHCAGCAMTIDGAVEDLAGVKAASTHYARQLTDVEYDEQRVTDKQIVDAILSAGYRAAALPPEPAR